MPRLCAGDPDRNDAAGAADHAWPIAPPDTSKFGDALLVLPLEPTSKFDAAARMGRSVVASCLPAATCARDGGAMIGFKPAAAAANASDEPVTRVLSWSPPNPPALAAEGVDGVCGRSGECGVSGPTRLPGGRLLRRRLPVGVARLELPEMPTATAAAAAADCDGAKSMPAFTFTGRALRDSVDAEDDAGAGAMEFACSNEADTWEL